jgi:chromosome segregation ATPase
MDKQTKSGGEGINELRGKIKAIRERILANGRETEATRERLEETRQQLELIEPREREIREKRQGLLADGKEVGEATEFLCDIREKRELLEDQIAGLQRKLLNLEAEAESLPREKEQHEMDLRGLMLIPLISQYNQSAEKLARIVEEIYPLVFYLSRPPHYIISSSWEGSLELIPRLYLPSECESGRMKHFFRLRDERERFVREGRKKIEEE